MIEMSSLTCYIGPNQASCFDCRFTSRMWYYFTYCHLTYITSNANQAQTQHISISVLIPAILRSVIKMQHHCRQLPAVSTLISTLAHGLVSVLAHGSHLHFFSVLCLHSTWSTCCQWQEVAVKVITGLERGRPLSTSLDDLRGYPADIDRPVDELN